MGTQTSINANFIEKTYACHIADAILIVKYIKAHPEKINDDNYKKISEALERISYIAAKHDSAMQKKERISEFLLLASQMLNVKDGLLTAVYNNVRSQVMSSISGSGFDPSDALSLAAYVHENTAGTFYSVSKALKNADLNIQIVNILNKLDLKRTELRSWKPMPL